MAKMTWLEMTQDILSDMSSDNVASIGATAESERVATIIKSTYTKMMEEKNWPHLGSTFQLTGLGDVARPSHMTIPTNIRRVEWLKYNAKVVVTDPDQYRTVTYTDPLTFLERINSRASTASNVLVVTDTTGVTLNIRTDVAPAIYTSFDDTTIVFDSYDSNLDVTMQQSKTQCFGFREPVWGAPFTGHLVSTDYTIGDVIAVLDATTGVTYYYRCSVTGTTAAIMPVYSTIIGATVVDGGASFVVVGISAGDSFVPDLPAQHFPLLLSQAKAQCFNKIKQVVDSQEERDAKRQRVIMQKKDHKNRQDGDKLVYGYGRK